MSSKMIQITCINCNTNKLVNKYTHKLKYCSNKCQKNYEAKEYIKRWLKGNELGWSGKTVQLSKVIRRYLKETHGSACSLCSWDGKHPVDGSSLTEIDHIDGNAHNCQPNNLRILCPNCHAMTDTYRARNKQSKRVRSSALPLS